MKQSHGNQVVMRVCHPERSEGSQGIYGCHPERSESKGKGSRKHREFHPERSEGSREDQLCHCERKRSNLSKGRINICAPLTSVPWK